MKNDLEFNKEALGAALRERREYLNLSLRELARASGVSHSQILRIESGEFDCLISSYVRLCGAMGINSCELLERCIMPDTGIYQVALEAELRKTCSVMPQLPDAKRSALADLVFGGCNILVYLLHSQNPVGLAKEFDYPSEALKSKFCGFAARVAVKMDPRTRREFIRQLQTTPVATFARYFSFPSDDEVTAHMQVAKTPAANRFYPWLQFLQPESLAEYRREDREWLEREFAERKKELTETSGSFSSEGVKVKPQWPDLKRRLQKATTAIGAKTTLAKVLDVDPTQISQWLSESKSAREPGAEYALQMLQWVELQERKPT
ncbi:MAG: helix-turn-helix transcriptional regulator [Verrucomicrobia bacterium]|nr:helix-turn-helix transcriptional regulator [Verrucomicrobiota bacterium]